MSKIADVSIAVQDSILAALEDARQWGLSGERFLLVTAIETGRHADGAPGVLAIVDGWVDGRDAPTPIELPKGTTAPLVWDALDALVSEMGGRMPMVGRSGRTTTLRVDIAG